MFTIALCDDEPSALQTMQRQLKEVAKKQGYLFQIKMFSDGESLIRAMQAKIELNIIFLDIVMPFSNGIAIADNIRSFDATVPIIFLSESKEYAFASYQVDAFDYLLKPLSKPQLEKTLQKVLQTLTFKKNEGVTLKVNGALRHIAFDAIEYIQVVTDKLFFYLCTGEVVEIYATMHQAESMVADKSQFFKCHRSIIINMQYIEVLQTNSVKTFHYPPVAVSRSNSSRLKNQYLQYAFSHSEV